MVLVDHADPQVLDLAAKSVAEDDQLHERQHHRDNNQGWTAPEAAQVAFDDGQDPVHVRLRSSFPRSQTCRLVDGRALQRIAQLMPRVMNEDVV